MTTNHAAVAAASPDLACSADPVEIDAMEIAVEAYAYAYPLLVMDATRRLATNLAAADCEAGGGAPINQFTHLRKLPDAYAVDVFRPNVDTLYSALWFEVSNEPLIVDIPDADRRFYALSLIDHHSDVFASPGPRTTGARRQLFGIVGPNWTEALPPGIRTYRSPTAVGWMLGLTEVNGARDLASVARFQASFSATPWSAWGKLYSPEPNVPGSLPSCDPIESVARMNPGEFFARFCELTRLNPPHAQDYPLIDRMNRIGLVPGERFQLHTLTTELRAAFERAPIVAQRAFKAAYERSIQVCNHWRGVSRPFGVYGTDYFVRAGAAFSVLGGHANEDAVCFSVSRDATGVPLDSSKRYTLTFGPHSLPPARAFWSLSLYNDGGQFVMNVLDRCALGSRDRLVTDKEGATTIYIQRESPGFEREPNWLPAPRSGGFSVTLRMYWPKPSVLSGRWLPPAIRRGAEGLLSQN
jgi:hypothetical protein